MVPELRKEVAQLRRANEVLKSASVFSPRSSTQTNEVSRYVNKHHERFGVEPICTGLDSRPVVTVQHGPPKPIAEEALP